MTGRKVDRKNEGATKGKTQNADINQTPESCMHGELAGGSAGISGNWGNRVEA